MINPLGESHFLGDQPDEKAFFSDLLQGIQMAAGSFGLPCLGLEARFQKSLRLAC
ncbi:TPA: hypothetical protein TVK16_001097 [Streptococcus equi subsp. zooepidemicus]|nr:hypothetical protein [Streptococcus equi subsp. zooepidemicus]